ncbi:MAG TPA: MarR family transcriptional regulator [Microlunatus sp.]
MRSSADLVIAADLLAHFSAGFTALVDLHLGTDWAENREILALLSLRRLPMPTTREVTESSGCNRRAVNRLVHRLERDGIVVTRPGLTDRRAVGVELTAAGRLRFERLAADLAGYFVASRVLAADIVTRLGGPFPEPDSSATDALSLLEELATVGKSLAAVPLRPAEAAPPSGRQLVALLQIAHREAVRPVDLTATLGASRTVVAYVLDQLVAKGLIIRRPGPAGTDRRAVLLSATPAGQAAADVVHASIEARGPELRRVFAAIGRADAGRDERVLTTAGSSRVRSDREAGEELLDPEVADVLRLDPELRAGGGVEGVDRRR